MNAYLYQFIIATPILGLQVILGILIVLMVINKDQYITRHFKKYGMIYGLVAAIAAMVGSLGFSIGYGYAPCDLCWYQRIFHYPQVLLFAIALYYKDARVWTYSLWLSIIGLVIAIYQILMQFNPNLSLPEVCAIIPAANSCSDILTQSYGYISIPVMSATLFVCLIMLYLYQKKKSHE